MHLSRTASILLVLIATLTGACSFFSNTVDEIKLQCKVEDVASNRAYVKVLDSNGKALKSSEFALRWLNDSGKSLSTQGNCINLDPKESAALIVRSRIGSEGLIVEADSEDRERLSSIQLEPYTYGPLRKTCDQLLHSNQLSLSLPVNFEDHTASGYEITATAIQENDAKAQWTFVNGGPLAPNLDISGLGNGRYDLRFEFNPLFSEGAVPQFFNCDLVVDRKSPQIALIAADGLALNEKSVELRPSSRVAWQSLNKTATELVEYCFVAAGTPVTECSNPSISNDPIVVPENGSWKFVYRGVDAASNRSDWVALDVDIVDEGKLAEIRNKLERARFYQKSGQTQFVAIQLLTALDAYRNLSSDNERKRVKKELDLAVFQHQRDARDYFVAQWGNNEAVNYLGTIKKAQDPSTYVFLREKATDAFGLSFVRDGSPLFPEFMIKNRSLTSTCPSQGYTAYVQDSRLQIFDGNTVTTLLENSERLGGITALKFSEDCRFLVMKDWIGAFFLIDRITSKTADFPEFEYDMECRFSFAMGEADATRYYSYCSRFNRNSWKLYAFTLTQEIAAPNVPILNQLPLQLISKDNFIFILANDKSLAVMDAAFKTLYSAPAGRMGEIFYDALRQRVMSRYEGFGFYDIYEFRRNPSGQLTLNKLSTSELRIPAPTKFGDSLTVSQPSFSPDLLYARIDDSTNSFLGHLPVDRDRLLDLDLNDLALFQTEGNLFREISPNASLLRRTVRLLRNELSVAPITRGRETVFLTMPVETGLYNRYELNFNESYVSLAKKTAVSKTLPKERIMTVYPYGNQELILLKGMDSPQFIVNNQDGTERTVNVSLPASAQAIPSSDPDLFWFHVPGEAKLYVVKASTGEPVSIESFHKVMGTIASRPVSAPLRIDQDFFAGHLYLAYPEFVIKLSYRGALDRPEFFASETKAWKSRVSALAPTGDFKKWTAISGMNLDVYNEAFEPEQSFPVIDIFGKRNSPSFQGLASGRDPETIFVASGNGQLARVDLKSGQSTSLAFDRAPTSNLIKSLSVDESGRLHYATGGDWFTLPLDLDENRQHLCRYFAELGSRMYPEIKAQWKQVSCPRP